MNSPINKALNHITTDNIYNKGDISIFIALLQYLLQRINNECGNSTSPPEPKPIVRTNAYIPTIEYEFNNLKSNRLVQFTKIFLDQFNNRSFLQFIHYAYMLYTR